MTEHREEARAGGRAQTRNRNHSTLKLFDNMKRAAVKCHYGEELKAKDSTMSLKVGMQA